MIVVPILVFLYTPFMVTYFFAGWFLSLIGRGFIQYALLLIVVVPGAFTIGLYLNYVTIPLFLIFASIYIPYYLILIMVSKCKEKKRAKERLSERFLEARELQRQIDGLEERF
jgi:hypothetical protein